LDDNCETSGLQSLSEGFHGKAFWERQLAAAEAERQKLIKLPGIFAKLDAGEATMTAKINNEVDDFLSDIPRWPQQQPEMLRTYTTRPGRRD